MKNNKTLLHTLPILLGFFVMGFCDLVGITSDYVQRMFGWSPTWTGFVPSMVFIWFLFLGIPVGNMMNWWGRKNTVLLSMLVTLLGMFLPLALYNSATCVVAYALLGIGNAILQVSLNPLLGNVITDSKMMTSALTGGQVVKAISSLVGPEVVLLAVSMFGEENWFYCFPLLGLVTLLSALWLLATPIPREQSEKYKVSWSATLQLLGERKMLLLFLGILFIVAVDVSTNFIGSKIMDLRFGWGASEVKFAPQAYFFCRTVGAFVGTFLLARVDEMKYFRYNIVACALSVLLLACISDAITDLVLIGCIGFFASSIFPVIYSRALKERPDKANQISGLLITAIAGGGIATPAIGFSIANIGITAGILVILACVLYLVYCAFTVK